MFLEFVNLVSYVPSPHIVEKLEDNPSVDENANRNRLWINITDCKPE
jgi:hypothetical protein